MRPRFDEDVLHMRQLLKTKLSGRIFGSRMNCLKAAEWKTVGDLVRFSPQRRSSQFRQEVALSSWTSCSRRSTCTSEWTYPFTNLTRINTND